jgi:hypothetical protein
MPNKSSQSKVTYKYETVRVLLLKEAFMRDLNLFKSLIGEAPKDWTYTVIVNGQNRELVVNIPSGKPNRTASHFDS